MIRPSDIYRFYPRIDPAEYFREFRFKDYLRFDFSKVAGDLWGGLTSAVVALPLALGFGILATGGDPRGAVAGLYGAVFTGILASLFGGTSQQITGPTGGMTVVLTQVFVEVSRTGGYQQALGALLLACLIAGLIQIAFGLFKLGRLVSYVPLPVITGFTNGIAILIFTQQIATFSAAPLVGLVTVAAIIAATVANKSLPKLFIGLLVGTVAAAVVGSRWDLLLFGVDWKGLAVVKHEALKVVGAIPGSLQAPQWPQASWEAWHRAIPAGFTIAILGCLETMLASVVVDSATNTEHNSNRELVGQGIGNTVAALFGGIAGTGAIVRTMINIRSGGVTKLSGVFCGLVLLAVVLFLGKLAGAIPLAALAGVLMMAAWGMFEWEPLRLMGRAPASDTLVMVTTMLVTVFSDLISAVLIGMVLAAVLFIHRMSRLGMLAEPEHELARLASETRELMRKHRVSVCSVEGPLFFGAVKSFSREITQASPNILILDMKGVPVIDLSGAQAIDNVVARMAARGKKVLISGMRQEARRVLHQMGVIRRIGADSFPDDLAKAADYAISLAQDRPPSLADYFKDDLVLLDAEAGSKKELFDMVTRLAVDKGYVHDGRAFLDNLWKREQDSPTSLGHGVAIPHSRSGAASDEVVVAFVRLRRPIPGYDGIDGRPVELVLMISAGPSSAEGLRPAGGDNVQGYLRVLKLITMAVGREEDRRRLMEAETVGQVLEVFGAVKE